jgi:V/A-type H+-transporting ATPase subunit A
MRLLSLLLEFYHRGLDALDRGVPIRELFGLPIVAALARASSAFGDDQIAELDRLGTVLVEQCGAAARSEPDAA